MAGAPAPKGPAAPPVNPLLNPNAPLSGPALLKAAAALAQAQYGPAISADQSQIAQNQQRMNSALGTINNYYTGLGQFAQQGNQQLGQIAGGLNQQLSGIAGDENARLDQIGQNALNSLASHAPGGDQSLVAPAQQALTAEIARQKGLAAQNEGNFRSFGAAQGANQQGLGAMNQQAFGLRGQEILGNVASAYQKANQGLSAQIAGLNAKKGALEGADLAKLRQQEVANQITRAGLGIKQQTLANTQAYDRGKLAVSQQNANTAAWRAQQDVNAKNWGDNPNAVGSAAWARVQVNNARQAKAQGKTPKVMTPAQNAAAFKALGSIVDTVQTMQKGGYKNSKGVVQGPQSNAAIRQALGTKFDPNLIQAAYELLGWGHITPGTAKALAGQRYNTSGWTYRGQPIRTAAAPAPPAAPTVAGVPLPTF
jgi:hypothetical protein